MRHSWVAGALLAGVVGCEGLDAGRPEERARPPVLVKITVQADSRGLVTDLLDEQPDRSCSDTDPCPVDIPGSPVCSIPEGMAVGLCYRPLSPRNTPPAIDTSANQVRVVFDHLLATDTASAPAAPGSELVRLLLDDQPVDAPVRYDPSGSPDVSADPSAFHYGPALVLDLAPLQPAGRYGVVIDAARITDKAGRHPERDVNRALAARYDFVAEGLYLLTEPAPVRAPNQVLSASANAGLDEASLTAGVRVLRDGAEVPHLAFLHLGRTTDTATCAAGRDDRTLDVVALDAAGLPAPWAAGEYTISFAGVKDAGTGSVPLGSGALDPSAVVRSFTVEGEPTDPAEDPEAYENFVLPARCTP